MVILSKCSEVQILCGQHPLLRPWLNVQITLEYIPCYCTQSRYLCDVRSTYEERERWEQLWSRHSIAPFSIIHKILCSYFFYMFFPPSVLTNKMLRLRFPPTGKENNTIYIDINKNKTSIPYSVIAELALRTTWL